MKPGESGAARSVAPMVSAIPAVAAPAMDTTSPALALSSSTLPTPLRLKIFVTLLSRPGAPALHLLGMKPDLSGIIFRSCIHESCGHAHSADMWLFTGGKCSVFLQCKYGTKGTKQTLAVLVTCLISV